MKKIIETKNAPAAIGSYSQAVQVDKTVYLSGQIPLVPETMSVVEGGFRAQVTQVFENLKAVAKAAGGDLSNIVKLQVYLLDMGEFAVVSEVMSTYFEAPYPARAVIEVSRLPRDVAVEMDGVLVLD